jgi:hypothetical protein
MKLINIALLSTALAAGIFTSSLPTYAADDVVAVDATTVMIDPPALPVVDEEPVNTDDSGTVDKPDPVETAIALEDPQIFEMSAGAPAPQDEVIKNFTPAPNERTLTSRDTVEEPVVGKPMDPAGLLVAEKGGNDNVKEPVVGKPVAPALLVAENGNSNSGGGYNDDHVKSHVKCKRGFFKCLFGTK